MRSFLIALLDFINDLKESTQLTQANEEELIIITSLFIKKPT